MTTEEWVRRVNALARKMDAACEGVHPTAWPELVKKDLTAWRRLAAVELVDDPQPRRAPLA